MKTKKVLLTSLSGQLGGLEWRLRDEACFLNAWGYDTEIALNPFADLQPWLKDLKQKAIAFHPFDPPPFCEQWRWRHWNKYRAEWFYRHYFQNSHADLIHVAMAWGDTGSTRLWLAHRCHIPTVISIHNAFPVQPFSPWTAGILQQAFESVKGVYAVSDSALEQGVQLFAPFMRPNTVQQVIYNPIDTLRFRPSARQRERIRKQLQLPKDALLIGMVGRLDKQKQPELLIDVFARLNKRIPHLHLLLIGKGPREAACRHSIEAHGLEKVAHMVGYQADVENWLPALDVHVLLSSREGFGIATAEAMACGVPVVATDVTGSRDILQHSQAGLLVPNGKPKPIVNAIADLLNNAPLRQRMADAGPREVAERFASPLIQLQLADFYRQVFARL